MKDPIITFLIILLFNQQLISQTTQDWANSYSSVNGFDEGVDLVCDRLGNIFVAGNSISGQEKDIVLIKYSSTGNLEWTRTYDGIFGDNVVKDLDIGEDGNVCLTGYSKNILGINDYLTLKYDTQGNLLWEKRYEDPFSEGAISSAVYIDNNNSVYVTGIIESQIGYNFTIKYSSAGDTIWTTKRYSVPSGPYIPVNINLDNYKNVYVSYGLRELGGIKIYIYDSLGIQHLFGTGFDGSVISNKSSAIRAENLYTIGTGRGFTANPDYFIHRYNSPGQPFLTRTYDCMGADRYDSAKAISLDNQGNIYMTGSTCDSISCFVSTVKYDSNLVFKWEKIFNTNTNMFSGGNGILADILGNVYITGASDDYLTIKYKPNGDSVWVKKFNGIGNGTDVANAIAMDSSGNIIVTGRSQVNGNDYDIVTVKYSQTVGIISQETVIPKDCILLQNYPNPFNPQTIISYDLSSSHIVKLIIYSIQGKEITSLVNSLQRAGKYSVNFDGSQISSGIYVCSLYTDNILVDSKKILLLK